MREDSTSYKLLDFFFGEHFTKLLAFLFAFMLFGLILQWYGATRYIEHIRGLQEVCKELGGVYVHEQACLKAENLFGDK